MAGSKNYLSCFFHLAKRAALWRSDAPSRQSIADRPVCGRIADLAPPMCRSPHELPQRPRLLQGQPLHSSAEMAEGLVVVCGKVIPRILVAELVNQ